MTESLDPHFPTATGSPRTALAGTVAEPHGGHIAADAYRRYRTAVTFRIPDHGSTASHVRSIFYEVGRRYNNAVEALAPYPDIAARIDCSVDIKAAEAANFEWTARRYSNFSPQWLKMDLAGIAERLAMGVAAYSVYGGFDSTALRGGAPLRVVALGTLDSPQTVSASSVFIPRTVDSVGNDSVFAVLVAAVNGCGATVTTDVLRMDADDDPAMVPAIAGAQFATACVEAMRMVGANMEASGAGDIFAYAVTRGIHHCVSVVAHTEEGGFMRDLLRHDGFRVPYGGINQALRHYPSLPCLGADSPAAISAWVDSIALKTAAAVAHCDPLVPGDGGLYPTVFFASVAVAVADTDADADARVIRRQIAADLGRFAPPYMHALTAIFGLHSNSGVAEKHFCTAAGRALQQENEVDEYLRDKTVAPYFWIEPTSLLEPGQFGTPAESYGYASKVAPGQVLQEPCFESFRILNRDSAGNHMTVALKMRSARTSALVCALAANPATLAHVRLFHFDSPAIVLAGNQGPTDGYVPATPVATYPLSFHLWRRGQSCFPAPSEYININGWWGAEVCLAAWDDDWNATLPALPDDIEMDGRLVSTRVTLPTGLPNGQTTAADRGARRARSRAAIAWAEAPARSRAFGTAASL